MSQKYHSSADPGNRLPRLITNDLYLAAFLLCQGSELAAVVHNGRRRLSFVFAGERVHELREEYETGIVRLNVRSYRDTLLIVRRRMDAEQRSEAYELDPGRGVRAAQA